MLVLGGCPERTEDEDEDHREGTRRRQGRVGAVAARRPGAGMVGREGWAGDRGGGEQPGGSDYRQPTTQPEIGALRGVSSSGVLKTLLDRGLIAESGRKESPGRPILYQTTTEFLKQFGLSDLCELPDLEDAACAPGEEAD